MAPHPRPITPPQPGPEPASASASAPAQGPASRSGPVERVTGSGLLLGAAAGLIVLASITARGGVLFALVIFAAVFIPLERLFTLRPQRILRSGWRTDLVHFLVNNTALNMLLFAVVALVGTALRLAVPGAVHAAVVSQPAWLQVAEVFTIAELGGYFGHRAAHQVPFLWRFHKVHHSITEMDWLAASHLHPLDQTFIRSCAILPIYALGFTKASAGGFVVVSAFYAIFVHSNIRFTFGPVRWFLGTPRFHHWHHSSAPEAYNSNYSSLFPVLDKVFGTLYLPARRWPEAYGIADVQPRGYLRQLGWPFRSTRRSRVPA